MRRLLVIVPALVGLLLVAGPALATESEAQISEDVGAATGMTGALIIGLILGAVIYADVFMAGDDEHPPAPPRHH